MAQHNTVPLMDDNVYCFARLRPAVSHLTWGVVNNDGGGGGGSRGGMKYFGELSGATKVLKVERGKSQKHFGIFYLRYACQYDVMTANEGGGPQI